MSAFIREAVLSNVETKPVSRQPKNQEQLLAGILARFGQSRMPAYLRELADAARSGSLILTPQLEQELQDACRQVRALRHDLVKALGLREANDR
jgi:hypothetical protein